MALNIYVVIQTEMNCVPIEAFAEESSSRANAKLGSVFRAFISTRQEIVVLLFLFAENVFVIF